MYALHTIEVPDANAFELGIISFDRETGDIDKTLKLSGSYASSRVWRSRLLVIGSNIYVSSHRTDYLSTDNYGAPYNRHFHLSKVEPYYDS